MAMKISNELRKKAKRIRDSRVSTFRNPSEYECLADRIDRELVELPKDADGVPIHVGDTVYGCRSGMKMTISDLRMTTKGWLISTSRGYLTDAEVTHTRPDSWECIADELEELSESNRINGSGEVFYRASDLAARIRKLAKKESQR